MRARVKKMAVGLPAVSREKVWSKPGFWLAAGAAALALGLLAGLRRGREE